MSKEIEQRVNDLEYMLEQSQKGEIDESILIEATAKLVILVAMSLLQVKRSFENHLEDSE